MTYQIFMIDVKITPKQDFEARTMYIDSNYISEFKIEEV